MKDYIIVILCAFAGGIISASVFWSKRKPAPAAIEYRDRIVEKVVEKRDVVTKIVKAVDGSSVTIITDKTEATGLKESEHKATQKPAALPQYGVRVSAQLSPTSYLIPYYEAELSKRLLGPVWLTAAYSTNTTASLGVRLEF